MAQAADKDSPRSKRGQILTAAVDSFGKDGYEHTKWAKIAGEVGIGQTALYHYFESKAHCLLTIMTMELDRSLQRFREATADVADARKALEAAVESAYDVTEREVLQMRILQNHMELLATPRPSQREESERTSARSLVREIEQEWTELLRRGMADGDFPQRDAHTMALVVLGMVVSVWRWYRPGGQMGLRDVRAMMSGACLRVVGA